MVGSIVAQSYNPTILGKEKSKVVYLSDNGSDRVNGSEGSSVGTVEGKPTVIDDGGVSIYRLEIDSERQMTNDGTATYKIVFTDQHKPESSVCGYDIVSGLATPCPVTKFKYKIEFEGKDGLKGEFSESECISTFTGSRTEVGSEPGITEADPGPDSTTCKISTLENNEFSIGGGQTKVFQLTVTTEKKGTSSFAVFIKDKSGVVAVGKASITFVKNGDIPPEEETAFFVGKGFVLSENKTNGFLLDLKILNKDFVLSGKAKIGERNYKIDGSVAEVAVDGVDFGYNAWAVKFDLIFIKTGEKVGSFEGQARQYTGFLLLEGKIKNFEGKTWTLTAMGKKKFEVREFDLDDGESVEVSVGEAVVVAPSVAAAGTTSASLDKSQDEVYIKPVKVTEKKVLWIFPTSKKVVEVEVVKGSEVFKKKITEYSYENVEGYKVSVGSLEDEESIEFDVEKA